jgi:NAD(P)-dependent dehydrogenase (short-subunit alcohol dehydrogenase family)
MEFQDRSVLVTGAAGGIGRATAVQFAREGARLTLSDRDTVRGEETLSAVRAVGGTAQFIYGDMVSEPFVQHLVDAGVKTYGRLDCAFNNAGIVGAELLPVDQSSLEAWQIVITVNLTSVFLCLKYETRAMLQTGGGAIVNTASALGQVAAPNMSAYCASKTAVVGLTRATGLDYAKRNIRVNAVLPATIETPMTTGTGGILVDAPELEQALRAWHPIGRFGHPDEVAAAVLWLASDKASFVTGHAMLIDGGSTVQ